MKEETSNFSEDTKFRHLQLINELENQLLALREIDPDDVGGLAFFFSVGVMNTAGDIVHGHNLQYTHDEATDPMEKACTTGVQWQVLDAFPELQNPVKVKTLMIKRGENDQ